LLRQKRSGIVSVHLTSLSTAFEYEMFSMFVGAPNSTICFVSVAVVIAGTLFFTIDSCVTVN
jgi:hypothetical protein